MKRIYSHQCAACGADAFQYHEDSHTETAYQWVCNDCGIEMGLSFSSGGQRAEQSPTGRRCERTLALLRMRDNPAFMFIYEGCAWGGDMSNHEYYYEEHTCPTNLMRCVEIIAGGIIDPHGVFEIVEERLITGPAARPREEVIQELTALAVEKTRVSHDRSEP